MPIYEYRCGACGERFEVLQRMGEGAQGLACPDCGNEQVDKQFSTFSSGSTGDFASSGATPGGASCGHGSGFR